LYQYHKYFYTLHRQRGFIINTRVDCHTTGRRAGGQCHTHGHSTVRCTDKQHRTVRHTTGRPDEWHSALRDTARRGDGRADERYSALGNTPVRYSAIGNPSGKTVKKTGYKGNGRELILFLSCHSLRQIKMTEI